jgi:hypothetical protein
MVTVKQRHLIVALAVAAVVAISLTGVAWWALQDGNDANDWLVRAIRSITFVILSKSGMKSLLVAVVAVGAGVLWLRSRRRGKRDQIAETLTDRGSAP